MSTQDLIWSSERLAFRGLADKATLMVWMTDAYGHCFYLNPQWYKFTGQTPGDGEGIGWLKSVHRQDRQKAEEAFMNASSTEAEYSVEYRLCRQDQEFQWVTAYGNPYYALDGEFQGYIGSNAFIRPPGVTEDSLDNPDAMLSVREKQVLQWTAVGKTSQEIGQILNISGRTAEFHARSAALKLNTTNRVQTVVEAIRRKEIEP